MNFRNISSWCIRNPVGPIVLFVGLMLAGFIAFARMQVNNAPEALWPRQELREPRPSERFAGLHQRTRARIGGSSR